MTCGRNSRITRTSGLGGHLDRLEREAALGQRRQRVALGQARSRRSPSQRVLHAEDLAAPRPSRGGAPRACRAGSPGRPAGPGLSTSPRSPPVQVTTSTSTPSATYLAIVAAPLLDSSSGCACTAISRSRSPTGTPRSRSSNRPVTRQWRRRRSHLVRAPMSPATRAPRRTVARRAAPPPGSRHRQVVGRRCRRVPRRRGPGHLVGAGQRGRPGHRGPTSATQHVDDRRVAVTYDVAPADRPRRRRASCGHWTTAHGTGRRR